MESGPDVEAQDRTIEGRLAFLEDRVAHLFKALSASGAFIDAALRPAPGDSGAMSHRGPAEHPCLKD